MPVKLQKASDIPLKSVDISGAKNTSIRVLISKTDGADNFAMRLFEISPGGNTPLHTHPHEHEVFILEGKGVCVYEGKEHKIEPEHFILVPGGKEHQFKNNSETVLRFLCLVPASAS